MSATGEVTAGRPGRGRRVILWRHGQTAWNVERRFQGSTDVALTETGVNQARRAAGLLLHLRPDAIVASDLARAADTAAELSVLTGLEVTLEEGLRETYAGVWQGLTHEEIITRYGDEYAAWKRPEDGTLVVVSHGGTIRTTIGRLLGLEPHSWESLGGLTNCCWSVLGEGARGWRLLEHNAGTLPEPVIGDDV